MIKSILFLIVLSAVAIIFQNQLIWVLHGILSVHQQIAKGLGAIFSTEGAGEIVQSVLALLLIPFVIGIIFAVAHFLLKQQHFPHTLNVVWACWAVLLTAMLSQVGHITNQSAEEIQSAHRIAEAVKHQRLADNQGKLAQGAIGSSPSQEMTQQDQDQSTPSETPSDQMDAPGGAQMDTPA